MKRELVLIIIVKPSGPPKGNLFEIVFADGHSPLFFRLAEHRKEHAGEDGDDSDNNEQFDEREGATSVWSIPVHGVTQSPQCDEFVKRESTNFAVSFRGFHTFDSEY